MSAGHHMHLGVDEKDLQHADHIEASEPKDAPGKLYDAAARGHAATDKLGHALIDIDPKASARLRLKLDLFLLPTLFFLYLFCFIDRANIGNARIAGLEADLGMAGYDYNIALTAFAICYIIAEIPSNYLCKIIGPGWYLPAITLVFGCLSICTAFVKSYGQLCAVRALLGIFEAGMMPGIAYYLSRWYTRSELAFRIACYIITAPLGGGFGGLLASGILSLDSIGSVRSWRMLFVVEGIITCCLALIAFLTMTDRPSSARWLNEEEKALAIARVKVERVGTTEVLDTVDRKKFVRGLLSPITLGTALIFGLTTIPVNILAFFLPTVIRTIYPGRTTVQLQLLTVPPYVVGAFFVLLWSALSWRLDTRNRIMIGIAPMMIVAYAIFVSTTAVPARYAAIFLITSSSYTFGVMSNAQIAANVVSDTARAAGIAMGVMGSNIGALIATWTFLPNDSPQYLKGNSASLGIAILTLFVAILLEWYMRSDNKKRDMRDIDAELEGLSQKQVQDLDWKHPAFRWKP